MNKNQHSITVWWYFSNQTGFYIVTAINDNADDTDILADLLGKCNIEYRNKNAMFDGIDQLINKVYGGCVGAEAIRYWEVR